MAEPFVRRRRRDLGHVPLSAGEIELLSRQDEAARRRQRLLLVREREKRAAQLVTQRYRENLRKLQGYRLAYDKQEHAQRQGMLLSALHEKYQLSLQGMGAAQRNAREKVMELVELAQIERRKWAANRRGEKERFDDAVGAVQEDAAERLARRREIERNLLRLKEMSAKQRSEASARAKRELEMRLRLQQSQEEAKKLHLRHADNQEFSHARKTKKDVTAYQYTRTHCVALPGPGALKVNTTDGYKEVKVIRHNRAQPKTVSAVAQAEAYREQMERRREEEWRLREENLRVADSRGQEALHVVESIRGGEQALHWLANMERIERVESTTRPGGAIHQLEGVRATIDVDGSDEFARQFGIDETSDIVQSAAGEDQPVNRLQRVMARRMGSVDESEDSVQFGNSWLRADDHDHMTNPDLPEPSLDRAADKAIEQKIDTMNELLKRIASYGDDTIDRKIKREEESAVDDEDLMARERYERWKLTQGLSQRRRESNPASDSSGYEDGIKLSPGIEDAVSQGATASADVVESSSLPNKHDTGHNEDVEMVEGNAQDATNQRRWRRQFGGQDTNNSSYSCDNTAPVGAKETSLEGSTARNHKEATTPKAVLPINRRSVKGSCHDSSSELPHNARRRSLEDLEQQLQEAIEKTTSLVRANAQKPSREERSATREEIERERQHNANARFGDTGTDIKSNELVGGDRSPSQSSTLQQYHSEPRRSQEDEWDAESIASYSSSHSSSSHRRRDRNNLDQYEDSRTHPRRAEGSSLPSLSESESLARGLTVVHPTTNSPQVQNALAMGTSESPLTGDNTAPKFMTIDQAGTQDDLTSTTATRWRARESDRQSLSSSGSRQNSTESKRADIVSDDNKSDLSPQSSHRLSSGGQGDEISMHSAINAEMPEFDVVPRPVVAGEVIAESIDPSAHPERGDVLLDCYSRHGDSNLLESSFSSFRQYSLPLSDSFSSINDSVHEHDNTMANQLVPIFPRSQRRTSSVGSRANSLRSSSDFHVAAGDTSVLLSGLQHQDSQHSDGEVSGGDDNSNHRALGQDDHQSHLAETKAEHDAHELPVVEEMRGTEQRLHYEQRQLHDVSFSSDSSSDVSAYAYIEKMQKIAGVSAGSARARLTRQQQSFASSNDSLAGQSSMNESANTRNTVSSRAAIAPDRRQSTGSSTSSAPSIDARFRYLVNMTEVTGRALPLHLNVLGDESQRQHLHSPHKQFSLNLSTSESENPGTDNGDPDKVDDAFSTGDDVSRQRMENGLGARLDLSAPPPPLFTSGSPSPSSRSRSENGSEYDDESQARQPYQQFSLEDLSKRLAAVLPPLPFASLDMSQPPAPLAWSNSGDEGEEEEKVLEQKADQEVPFGGDPNEVPAGLPSPSSETNKQSEPSSTAHRKGVALFVPLDTANQTSTSPDSGVESLAEAFRARHPGIRSRAESTKNLLEQRREQLAERRATAVKDDELASSRGVARSHSAATSLRRSASPIPSRAASRTAETTPAAMAMPKPELLSRLASGERPKISREEMHERTRRLYNQLPEVAEKKRQEDVLGRRRQRLAELREREKARREQQRRRRDDAA